jgi:hypothetical protein
VGSCDGDGDGGHDRLTERDVTAVSTTSLPRCDGLSQIPIGRPGHYFLNPKQTVVPAVTSSHVSIQLPELSLNKQSSPLLSKCYIYAVFAQST